MNNKKLIVIIVILLLVLVGLLGVVIGTKKSDSNLVDNGSNINSFEDCVKAGFPILESYPEQCNANGKHFVHDVGNEMEKLDLIKIDTPRPNQKVTSPLAITGQARGTWYFEASFPVRLLDAQGKVLASTPAQAQGEWMTENFVPYKAELKFASQSSGSKGKLILQKDNPSDMREKDDQLEIPVEF